MVKRSLEQIRQYNRTYMAEKWRTDPQFRRRSSERAFVCNLKRLYGITVEQYNAAMEQQGGACALCKKKYNRRLAVDHHHHTKRIRGLLCNACNGALGQLGDDEAGLLRALAYIRGEPPWAA